MRVRICNDRPYSLGPVVLVNGAAATLDTLIADRAEVDIRLPRTVYEVVELAEIKASVESGLHFSVNGQDYTIPSHIEVIELNGRPVALTDVVRQGDVLVYRQDEITAPSIQDVIPLEEWVQETMIVHFNGERVVLPVAQVSITVDGKAANASDPVSEGADITVKSSPASTPVFSDVFRFVDVSLEKPDRESISGFVMLVNGEQANFQTELKSGDKLELFWE